MTLAESELRDGRVFFYLHVWAEKPTITFQTTEATEYSVNLTKVTDADRKLVINSQIVNLTDSSSFTEKY